MEVRSITKEIANAVVSNKHYSRRLGIFWEGFGLYEEGKLIGVCCFGQPSAALQKHAFNGRDFRFYELTRLVVDDGHKNASSFLISRALKMLKNQPAAIVSYADSYHGHSGVVYQASNWLYTGSTVSHDKLYIVDGVPTHPMTLRDKMGITSPAKWAKENGIKSLRPDAKHRYFYFVGTKKETKNMKQKLLYPTVDYPKNGAKSTYDAGEQNCEYYANEHRNR